MEVQLPAHSCGTPGERPQGTTACRPGQAARCGLGGKTSSQLGSAEPWPRRSPLYRRCSDGIRCQKDYLFFYLLFLSSLSRENGLSLFLFNFFSMLLSFLIRRLPSAVLVHIQEGKVTP